MNAYANDCVPDFHQKHLYAKFHNGINNNLVRNLPAGTKYGCNAVEIGDKTKVVCLYEKQ
ncbi:hypothetical protein COOONC_08091 [Cooperia oncophora]